VEVEREREREREHHGGEGVRGRRGDVSSSIDQARLKELVVGRRREM
jgi:hypothetical protein